MIRSSQGPLLKKDWLGMPLAAWAILMLTTVLSLVWSQIHLYWVDELLVLYTDSLPTFRDVIRVQMHYPIVIDPPFQHLLAHAFVDLLGPNKMALRMPSLIGFLLFQGCVYVFCSRMAGKRAGIIAMLFPLCSCTVYQSLNARPYAMLMGLFLLSLVCWQRAARADDASEPRMGALVGLWLALALTLSTQYFGVLVLLPVWIGEIVRTVSKRRIDRPMVVTLVLGVCSVALILPFVGAGNVYRQHFIGNEMTWRYTLEMYRAVLIEGLFKFPHTVQMAILAGLVLVLVLGAITRLQRRTDTTYEWAALAALGLLPVFGHELEVHVTHALLPRYVVPAAGAFAIAAGLVSAALIRKTAAFYAMAALLLGVGLSVAVWDIQLERVASATLLASYRETPAVRDELNRRPEEKIYFQTVAQYMVMSYYEPDPQRRARMVLVMDQEQLKWENSDNLAILTEYLPRFSALPLVTYDHFLSLKDPLIVFYTDQPDNDAWIDRDLKMRGRDVKPIGPWINGTLAETHAVP